MAIGKEIRTKIKSVQSTQKITRAMEMVAASKMRKAQERMRRARPYADKLRHVISHLAYAHPEYRHRFMIERETKRVGLIIVTSDRGLCGGLNTNLLKTTLVTLRGWNEKNTDTELCTIGAKGFAFLKRVGGQVVSHVSHLGDTPRVEQLIGAIKTMLDNYNAGKIDRLYIVYNSFINTMAQQPIVEQLLPLPLAKTDEAGKLQHYWDYIYEPDAQEVIDDLLMRYIETLVYQAAVENLACEQSARMVAMKAASDNAGQMIDELKLRYNKARQAAITQEISEIVGGAAAV